MRTFDAKLLYAGLVALTVWLALEAGLTLIRLGIGPPFSWNSGWAPWAYPDWTWAWLALLALISDVLRRVWWNRSAQLAGTAPAHPGTRALRDGMLGFLGVFLIVWATGETLEMSPSQFMEQPLWNAVSPAGHFLCGVLLVLWPARGREHREGA